MNTIEQAYDALIRHANNAGRRGLKLYQYGIIPPASASGTYQIVLDVRPMKSSTESWEA